MNWTFTRESELSAADEAAIRRLLVATFPQHSNFFYEHSFWGSPPEYRLTGREESGPPAEPTRPIAGSREFIAHLGFGCRVARVGPTPVTIAGIGAVAVHPEWQGRKIGKAMFAELREFLRRETSVAFGFLECREVVVGFYERAGLRRVYQAVYSQDPDTGIWLHHYGPVMVLPVHKRIQDWPKGKVIDLRGMPW